MPDPQAADVLEQDRPDSQVNAEEIPAVPAKVGEDESEATPKETDAEIEEKGGKRLGGWQRKIQKLEREREVLIEALRKGGTPAEPSQKVAPDAPVRPVRPKITEFPNWNDYETAMDTYETAREKYSADIIESKLQHAEAVKQQTSERQSIADGWADKIVKARSEIADFDEVAFSEDTPMSEPMLDAIVTSELGAQIAYELGKNQDEAERISKLPPVAAIREIGKIESRIASHKPAKEGEEEPPEASTKAPKPPVPVRRPAGNTGGEPGDDRPYGEWLKWRDAQLRK